MRNRFATIPRKGIFPLAPLFLLAVLVPLTCIGSIVIASWFYTTTQLQLAEQKGIYLSAEAGMRSLIADTYRQPDDVQVIYAGTNSFDGSSPHLWYVIACVWGGRRADGSPVGSAQHVYDQPGSFFLNTRQGWVHVSEGAFPEFVGFWAQVFGLAGPGSSVPSHDWGAEPTGGCIF